MRNSGGKRAVEKLGGRKCLRVVFRLQYQGAQSKRLHESSRIISRNVKDCPACAMRHEYGNEDLMK